MLQYTAYMSRDSAGSPGPSQQLVLTLQCAGAPTQLPDVDLGSAHLIFHLNGILIGSRPGIMSLAP